MPKLPDDFVVNVVNPIPRRGPKRFGNIDNEPPRGRRRKGVPNKISRDLRALIIEAAERLGSDGLGRDGALGYLMDLAANHRKSYAMLLARLLPLQLRNDGLPINPITNVTITTIPSGSYVNNHDNKPVAPTIGITPAIDLQRPSSVDQEGAWF